MTVEMIGPEAEALLDWPGLIAALEAGHSLPRAEINVPLPEPSSVVPPGPGAR